VSCVLTEIASDLGEAKRTFECWPCNQQIRFLHLWAFRYENEKYNGVDDEIYLRKAEEAYF
jgi:hypothetical protein